MRALVVGGIGYVGGRLVAYLKKQGHHVAVTTRRTPSQIPAWLNADEVLTVGQFERAQSAFKNRDIIFHLAAPDEIAADKNPLEALNAGADYTWLAMQCMVDAGVSCPFIYLSTFHIYGKNAQGTVTESTIPYPVHPYGLGRYLGECVVQSFRQRHSLKTLCVRMSNSFGVPAGFDVPRWTLIFNDLCRQAILNKELVLKSPGLQERNFITLHDATRGLEFLAQKVSQWPDDGLLHLGSDDQWSVLTVAQMIADEYKTLWGQTLPIRRPEPKPGEIPNRFGFTSERLARLGFVWENPYRDEIKATLEMCRQNLQASGHPH